jgi:ketosteroid isomerase-like protein
VSAALAGWHAYMESGDLALLDALLADDAVFESPVVHTPQVGKAITYKYLASAAKVLGGEGFRYLGEWHAEDSAILEFETEIDGITVNGIDMIWWNEAGQITRFKVMVRPLKAINMLHQMMGAQLAKG